MNTNQTPVIWTIVVATVLLLGLGFWAISGVNNAVDEVKSQIPTSQQIVNEVISKVDVPTAESIANLIEIPEQSDTTFSIKDEKEVMTEQLAREELEDDEFLEWLAGQIDVLGGVEIDEDDITSIDVRDVEVEGIDLWPTDETATAEFEARVYFNNYGDEEESVRVTFDVYVEGLNYDDDYEDAEVDGYGNYHLVKCYNDLC